VSIPHERPSPYGAPPAVRDVPLDPATHHPAYTSTGMFPLPKLPSDFTYGVSIPVNLPIPSSAPAVRGYDFSSGADPQNVLSSFITTGFQATNFGLAVREIERMRGWSLADEPVAEDEGEELRGLEARRKVRCKIFLGYTSNMISCGVRESIRFLAQNRMVDVMVTTAGGIEEDFMKCLAPVQIGAFDPGPAVELRMRGINRTGNIFTMNDNYCAFEDWLSPILDAMLEEQKRDGVLWTPSRMIHRLGKEINHPDSVYYWCYRHNIPVFCPAITDGSIGDLLHFHSFSNPGLVLDIIQDIRAINLEALNARKRGAIVLGGGVPKHHVMNACLMANGADFSVTVSTAQEFDGSDSGAAPSEAITWGKIKWNAKPVKVHGDASIIFPLLVSQTFAKKE
jgi:deoxyhypusine synthase